MEDDAHRSKLFEEARRRARIKDHQGVYAEDKSRTDTKLLSDLFASAFESNRDIDSTLDVLNEFFAFNDFTSTVDLANLLSPVAILTIIQSNPSKKTQISAFKLLSECILLVPEKYTKFLTKEFILFNLNLLTTSNPSLLDDCMVVLSTLCRDPSITEFLIENGIVEKLEFAPSSEAFGMLVMNMCMTSKTRVSELLPLIHIALSSPHYNTIEPALGAVSHALHVLPEDSQERISLLNAACAFIHDSLRLAGPHTTEVIFKFILYLDADSVDPNIVFEAMQRLEDSEITRSGAVLFHLNSEAWKSFDSQEFLTFILESLEGSSYVIQRELIIAYIAYFRANSDFDFSYGKYFVKFLEDETASLPCIRFVNQLFHRYSERSELLDLAFECGLEVNSLLSHENDDVAREAELFVQNFKGIINVDGMSSAVIL